MLRVGEIGYMKLKLKKNLMAQNTLWSFTGKIVAMLFLVILDVIAARMLSVENYAEWVFFFSILTMLFYVGWMGINTSAKVYVSKCIETRERDNCIRASLMLRFVVSVIIAVLIMIIMPRVAGYLGYPYKYPELKTLLCIAAILVFFNSFTEYFKEIFIGLQEYKNLFMITACEYGGYFLFSIIMLLCNSTVQSIALGYAVSGICIFFIGFFLFRNKIGVRYINTDIHYKEYIAPVIKYALPIAVISFGGLILVEMDTFMLGLLSTKVEVANYSIAKSFCSKATHVNYALTVGTMTTFSVLTAENIKEKRKQFNKLNKINLLITFGISSVMLVFSTIAIVILYGEEYRSAGTIMCLLVPYYALYSISNFYSAFLDFRGKATFRSVCYISIIIINLVLNYLLIPIYGAKGAAIATDLSMVPYTVLVTIAAFKQFTKFQR